METIKEHFMVGNFSQVAVLLELGHDGDTLAPHEASRILSIVSAPKSVLKGAKAGDWYSSAKILENIKALKAKTRSASAECRLIVKTIDQAKSQATPDEVYITRLAANAASYSRSGKEEREMGKALKSTTGSTWRENAKKSVAEGFEKTAKMYRDAILAFARTGEITLKYMHPDFD